MRTFYSIKDVEDLVAKGINELIIDNNTTLTNPAKDLLNRLGIKIIFKRDNSIRSVLVSSRPVLNTGSNSFKHVRSSSGRIPLLQLALDYVSVPSALAMALQVRDFIDIIEIGTPLIKVAGVEGVKAMKEVCPDKLILADFKAPDVGGLEAQLAFDAGADIMTVIGGAAIATVKEALKIANDRPDKEVQIECTGVRDIVGMASEWKEAGVDRLVYHREWDAQAAGREWEQSDKDKIQQLIDMGFKVTVTGGLNPDLLPFFSGMDIYTFICGRAIHKAPDPRAAAKKMKDTIQSIWGGSSVSTSNNNIKTSTTGTTGTTDKYVDRAIDIIKKNIQENF